MADTEKLTLTIHSLQDMPSTGLESLILKPIPIVGVIRQKNVPLYLTDV